MKTIQFIVLLFLIGSDEAAFADILNLSSPKPAPFAKCENEYPDGPIGSWRVDHSWTNSEDAESESDSAVSTSDNAVEQGNSGTLTITADFYITDLPSIGKIKRSYRIIGGSAHRYTIELIDNKEAVWITTLELVPCGLVMEQRSACLDAFCKNFLEEIIRTAFIKAGQKPDEALLASLVEQSLKSQKPQASQRTYYRRIVADTQNATIGTPQ